MEINHKESANWLRILKPSSPIKIEIVRREKNVSDQAAASHRRFCLEKYFATHARLSVQKHIASILERSWERAMVNGQWASEFFSNKNESVENMLASSLRPSWVAITRMTVLTRAYQAYFSSFFLRPAKKNTKPEWARKCEGMTKVFDASLYLCCFLSRIFSENIFTLIG